MLSVIALAIAGVAISATLLLEHHGEGAATPLVQKVCGVDANSGCAKVKGSRFSEIDGVPLAAAGLFYFGSLGLLLVLALLAGPEARASAASLALLLTAGGLLIDLALLAIQLFAIHALCTLCLLSYVPTVAALVLLLPARSRLGGLRETIRHEGTRLLAGAWVVASLALALAVAGAEGLLDGRQVGRLAGNERPVESLSLAAARGEVQRLRAILQDPAKLERYLTQRAFDQYEQAPEQPIDLSRAPTRGPAAAPIHVVVFTDLLCPWCRQLARGLSQFLPHVSDRVALSFKNFPLDQTCHPELSRTLHPGACLLARGGVCAAAQGRFWQYHDRVFSSELEHAEREDVLRFARQAGLDLKPFERCLVAPSTLTRVTDDIAEGRRLGVDATPTLFVNGKRLAQPDLLPTVIGYESQRRGLPAPTPPEEPTP